MNEGVVPAARGYRGARLGAPYEFSWVDKEPTNKTWEDLSRRRSFWAFFIGWPSIIYLAYQAGGSTAAFFVFLISALPMFLLVAFAKSLGRSDGEPVPKLVHREAWIEHDDGIFYFSLAVDGKPEIWQPWEIVSQFERADYWSMFGDAGASPYKTGWHAIVMTPPVGRPWLIASTIEAEAEVRDRFSQLDHRFSADARTRFLRLVEVQKKQIGAVNTARPATTTGDEAGLLVPNSNGVPNRL